MDSLFCYGYYSLAYLHILKTHESYKDVSKIGYKNSTGLRDNEILETVLKIWTKENNFKNFT